MDDRDVFDSVLEPGERVLWSGSPSADRLLMRNDYLLIPLGILLMIVGFTGFGVTISGVLRGDTQFLPGAVWVLLLPLGFHCFVGHLILRRRNALRTHYALTDRRVLRLKGRGASTSHLRQQALASSPRVRVAPQYEGRATIRVGALTLFNISGHQRVESLIRQQLPAR